MTVSCTGGLRGTARLTVGRRAARRLDLGGRTVASRNVQCFGTEDKRVTLKPSKGAARKLRRAKGSVKIDVVVAMGEPGEKRTTVTRSVTLKR